MLNAKKRGTATRRLSRGEKRWFPGAAFELRHQKQRFGKRSRRKRLHVGYAWVSMCGIIRIACVTPMDTSSLPQAGRSTRRVWPIAVGVVLLASLMALRSELSPVWVRAAVAGCAFAVLWWGVFMSRRLRS
jgi:hypothetical protein